MLASSLIKKHRIISEQIRPDELRVLLEELEKVIKNNIEGDVVELGCYEGTSALFLKRLMLELQSEKRLWLYDSFEGLPEKTKEDASAAGEQFKAGELKASKARLERNFHKAGLPPPIVYRTWFYEIEESELPEQICFAFLDGDFYESIMDSFRVVWEHLAPGAVVVVDDYQNAALPGAKKAVDEWVMLHNLNVRVEKTLAIISA